VILLGVYGGLMPCRLMVHLSDTPQARVVLTTAAGQLVDLTEDVLGLHFEVDPQVGSVVTLTLRAGTDIDFPVERVQVTGNPLEGLTANELDGLAASAGMSSGPGAAILAHLRARLGIVG